MSRKDPTDHDDSGGKTALGLSRTGQLLLIVGASAVGLLLGFFLPRVAAWVTTLPWAPFQGPFELVASFEGVWVVVICLAAGLVLGLALAFVIIVESLKVTLTDSRIRVDKDDRKRVIERADVDAVFLDGKNLVVLDSESRQLLREACDTGAAKVARAFRAHGYPWVEADPYAELYRRWVPDTPDTPPAANAVLAAREAMLEKKAAKDVVELREELQKIGVVVRDDGTKQYWRPLVRS